MDSSRKAKKRPAVKSKKPMKSSAAMRSKSKKTESLDHFVDRTYGKRGTQKRDKLESGYEDFKVGALLLQARLERGMTQEQLADKTGTTKSYISKIENNIKEVRISTLQKIVEQGLGGTIQLSIRL